MLVASVASAQTPEARECTRDSPSTWSQADLNNQRCAVAGLHLLQNNPAIKAAAESNAAAGDKFSGDPFRAPRRWAGKRGSYQDILFKHRDGKPWPAAMFGPRDLNAGPYPGVLLVCHACGLTPPVASLWYWAAEALAEAGYIVFYAVSGGNNVPRAIEATDFLVSTPGSPTSSGEFFPWHASLDRTRLAVVGHSGAAGVALTAGHMDPRFDAIVAWDPAGSYAMKDAPPRIPSMIQIADYRQEQVPPANAQRPKPALPKFAFFDAIKAANVDVMQVVVRASTHLDWGPRLPPDTKRPHSIHGEMVATYYTLAWLDRYLQPSRAGAALKRLTASGKARFDRSADAYSIGAGFFDAKKAQRAGNPEAGNVPITVGGLTIRNLLSFHYDSKFFLGGGRLQCADMRAGCP